MKHLAALLLMCFCRPVKAAHPPIDSERMLAVLAEMEGGAWGKPGGPAQISYIAWAQHSPHAYQMSGNRDACLPILRAHLAWLLRNLSAYGGKPTPHDLAIAWRRGLAAASTLKWRDEYGTRAANLYADADFATLIP